MRSFMMTLLTLLAGGALLGGEITLTNGSGRSWRLQRVLGPASGTGVDHLPTEWDDLVLAPGAKARLDVQEACVWTFALEATPCHIRVTHQATHPGAEATTAVRLQSTDADADPGHWPIALIDDHALLLLDPDALPPLPEMAARFGDLFMGEACPPSTRALLQAPWQEILALRKQIPQLLRLRQELERRRDSDPASASTALVANNRALAKLVRDLAEGPMKRILWIMVAECRRETAGYADLEFLRARLMPFRELEEDWDALILGLQELTMEPGEAGLLKGLLDGWNPAGGAGLPMFVKREKPSGSRSGSYQGTLYSPLPVGHVSGPGPAVAAPMGFLFGVPRMVQRLDQVIAELGGFQEGRQPGAEGKVTASAEPDREAKRQVAKRAQREREARNRARNLARREDKRMAAEAGRIQAEQQREEHERGLRAVQALRDRSRRAERELARRRAGESAFLLAQEKDRAALAPPVPAGLGDYPSWAAYHQSPEYLDALAALEHDPEAFARWAEQSQWAALAEITPGLVPTARSGRVRTQAPTPDPMRLRQLRVLR